MKYEVTPKTALRGLLGGSTEEIWEAKVTDENATAWFSRWHDEDLWVLDAVFTAGGFPVFCNGLGSRCTAYRVLPEDDSVARVLNATVDAVKETAK